MASVRLTTLPAAMNSGVVDWAIGCLRGELTARGVRAGDGATIASDDLAIRVDLDPQIGGPESFRFAWERDGVPVLTVTGTDERGLSYGVLELADIVEHETDPVAGLHAVPDGDHAPATEVRSVLRTLTSQVQDLSWFHDRAFWDEYLTHLATHRINRFQLALGMQYNYSHDPGAEDTYLAFAYPFLVDPDGFDVRAAGVSDSERAANLETLRWISAQAHRRGIHFQLGLWNHAFDFLDSPNQRYPISGLSQENVADYCRAGLREILTACPDIDGITVRVHYEGGVHEPSHEFWAVVLQGLADVGRPIELDMHSKGVDERIIDAARGSAGAFTISAKFWAEHWGLPYHQAAVREMEYAKPERSGLSGVTRGSRRFTRYGYGDFLPTDRDYGLLFRIWPGTQRVLEWADPEQVAAIARSTGAVGGVGIELCEPLTFLGRKTTGTHGARTIYDDPDLHLDGDPWRKYADTYRVWGRFLYEPDGDRAAWYRALTSRHGAAGHELGAALTSASRILPLVTTYHSPSASNNFYWPEIYVNMPIAGGARSDHYAFDTPEPGSVGAVSPFDPEMFAPIDDFVDETISGRRSGRYTPVDVTTWLDQLVASADEHLAAAQAKAPLTSSADRRTSIDIAALARLGQFFADKLRASMHYAFYTRLKAHDHLRQAVEFYRSARQAFAVVADLTTVYVDDLAFGDRVSERGHWADRLPAIDADLAALEAEYEDAATRTDPAAAHVLAPTPPRPHAELHAPATFTPGEELAIRIDLPLGLDAQVYLHYRHLNQGEEWNTAPTRSLSGQRTGTIPSDYTDSRYALQVYATIHTVAHDAWIIPGFNSDRTNQPYVVIAPITGSAS